MSENLDAKLAIVKKFQRALEDLDYEAVEQLLSEDAVFGTPGNERKYGGKEITAYIKTATLDKLHVTSARFEVKGEKIFGPYVLDHRYDFATLDIPGKGAVEIRVEVASCYYIEDGRIKEWTEWMSPDSRAALEAALAG